jgi:hypothetical protein
VTHEKVENELRSLPSSLDETYDRLLNSLDEFDKPKAKSALRWLVFSGRQLYVEELIDASAFNLEKPPMLGEKLDSSDIQALLEDLILIQPPLPAENVAIEPETYTVILMHASIREFLVRKEASVVGVPQAMPYFALPERESKKILAQICLAYLLLYNTYELRHCNDEYPLRNYAWYHWEDHIDIVEAESCVPTIPTAILRRKARRFLNFIQEYPGQNRNQLCSTSLPDLETLWNILDGLAHISESSLDIRQLNTALNVPFFYPNYDAFCPAMDNLSKPQRGLPDHNLNDLPKSGIQFRRVGSYQHRSLPDMATNIRLVEILPALDPNTEIQCRVFIVSLKDPPPYAALSYIWGGQHSKTPITIEGHTFLVLPSQLMLLSTMRTRSESRYPAIWLDYLCIDQANIEETRSQVQILTNVYSQAREVVVGLSVSHDEISNKAIHLLSGLASAVPSLVDRPNFADSTRLVEILHELDCSQGWHSILQVFDHPWWKRAWVVLEIVVSRKALILFGSISFNFNLVERVMLAAGSIKEELRRSKSPSLDLIQKSHGWYAAEQIVRTKVEYGSPKKPPLAILLGRFRYTLAANPKDKIFALLGMCDPRDVHYVQVDYSKPSKDLASQVSRSILESSKNLDFLSVVSSTFQGSHQPLERSWTISLDNTYRDLLGDTSLMFDPALPRIYSTAGEIVNSVLQPSEADDMLSICGMVFDEVASSFPITFNLNVRDQLADYCKTVRQKWVQGMEQTLPHCSYLQANQKPIENVWRTLLADQWPLGTRLRATTLEGVQIPPRTEEEEDAFLDIINIRYDLPHLGDRQVVITTKSRIGLVPSRVRPGDALAVMPGGALPYVLRPCGDARWKFLGDWYVVQ